MLLEDFKGAVGRARFHRKHKASMNRAVKDVRNWDCESIDNLLTLIASVVDHDALLDVIEWRWSNATVPPDCHGFLWGKDGHTPEDAGPNWYGMKILAIGHDGQCLVNKVISDDSGKYEEWAEVEDAEHALNWMRHLKTMGEEHPRAFRRRRAPDLL